MKIRFTILALGVFWGAFGQKVNYEVVKDQPFKPRASINLDYFQMDINSKAGIDNIAFGLGLYGHFDPLPFAGLEFNIRKSYLVMGKLAYAGYRGTWENFVGVHFMPINKTKTKETKIVLDSETYRAGDKEITNTTFIMVPAQVLKKRGVHAGLYQKSGPFNADDYFESRDDYTPPFEYGHMSSFGIYAGIKSSTVRNIIIKDPDFGRSQNSVGYDLSLDLIVAPVNRFRDMDTTSVMTNMTQEMKDNTNELPFGFRLAYSMYQVEVKAFTGKKFGMSATGELGYKPYFGFFLNAGLGITLMKREHWFKSSGKATPDGQ